MPLLPIDLSMPSSGVNLNQSVVDARSLNANVMNPLLNEVLQKNAKPSSGRTRAGEKQKSQKSSLFAKILSRNIEQAGITESFGIDETLPPEKIVETLLDAVHSAGDTLQKRPFPPEIKAYRESIKRFINYVLQKGYDIEQSEGVPNRQKPQFKNEVDPDKRNKRKAFSTVKIIDQKLDKLAADLVMMQMPQIKLLAKVNEIEGLLVDLLR
ncbi:MAG: hypothetical protein Ta2B_21630 [Termitinemataceae bacterium]|nr:MAG: hypothetical protein Ta2B_21630 [Termitinemataceae bacterium]